MSKTYSLVIAIGIFTSTLALFQNCAGNQSEFVNVLAAQSAQFFAYPYTSAPSYYADIAVYKPAAATGSTLTQFQVVASMTAIADSTAVVPYVFAIYGDDGITPICPQNSGSVTPPVTTIVFNCFSARPGTTVNIHLVLGSGAAQQTLIRQF